MRLAWACSPDGAKRSPGTPVRNRNDFRRGAPFQPRTAFQNLTADPGLRFAPFGLRAVRGQVSA